MSIFSHYKCLLTEQTVTNFTHSCYMRVALYWCTELHCIGVQSCTVLVYRVALYWCTELHCIGVESCTVLVYRVALYWCTELHCIGVQSCTVLVYRVARMATDSKQIPQMVLVTIKGYKLDLPHPAQGCQRKDVLPEVLAQVEV